MVSGVFSIPLPNKKRTSGRGSARDGKGARGENGARDGRGSRIAEGDSRFEAFIGGPENRLALASVETLLRSSEHTYNPLVLCGGLGTGKSLLAGGLARRWQDASGSRAGDVKATDAESFAAEFHASRQPRRLSTLRQSYRNASLVVIDDLHKLPTNKTIQRELCGLIDDLTAEAEDGRCGQLIITTRILPEAIPKLLPALVSRLSAGLLVPLAPAGEAARRAMVESCCNGCGLELTDEAIDYLAAGDYPAVADLPVAVSRLPLKPGQSPLSLSVVRQFVPRPSSPQKIRIDRIARQVAKYYSLTIADLKSSSRRRNVATARRMVVYLARERCEKSFSQIGKFLGGRDHTTVLYNHQKATELLKTDSATQKALADLTQILDD